MGAWAGFSSGGQITRRMGNSFVQLDTTSAAVMKSAVGSGGGGIGSRWREAVGEEHAGSTLEMSSNTDADAVMGELGVTFR